MAHPRLETQFGDGNREEPNAHRARNQRQYSWIATPVEMGGRRNQQSDNAPPMPLIPHSHRQAPESGTQHVTASAEYSYDQKPDPRTMGTHPSVYAPYIENTGHASQPRAQFQGSIVPPSPGPLPSKADYTSPERRTGAMIAPDENPLTPTTPSHPHERARPMTYAPQATSTTPAGFENHNPGQASHPNQQVKGGTWKHGLCDCGEIGICCTGLWCPCILYGKTQYRLSQRSEKKDPTNMLGYETLNGSCAVFAVLCGCNWVLAAIQHTRVRKAYEIPGSVGSDCVRGLCCSCCLLSQDEKEIKYRENQTRQNAGPVSGAQYAAPNSMTYPAPPK